MSYYKPCPYCNSNLDPGEACDCQKKAVVHIIPANRDKKKELITNEVSKGRE